MRQRFNSIKTISRAGLGPKMRLFRRVPRGIFTLFLGAMLFAAPLSPAHAQTDPAESARLATIALGQAAVALRQADGSRDRVAALTQTVRAYETGLDAMREGLRRATIRQAAIQAMFDADRDRLSRLLGVLQSVEAMPAPVTLLHPDGALGAARSSMILSDVVPSLQAEAENLRRNLKEMADLRALQEGAVNVLEDGLAGVQDARAALSLAISDRTDLPRRFFADQAQMRILFNATDTLESFADGLMQIDVLPGSAIDTAIVGFSERKGHLILPVFGRLLHRYLETDAAGIARPGLILATRALSLVTLPAPATIRYAGPLLDYGQVAIIEPSEGYLIILAGMGQVYGAVGEVLPEGAPIGMMGGQTPQTQAFLIEAQQGITTGHSETLYIEIREHGSHVDPGAWFALNGE